MHELIDQLPDDAGWRDVAYRMVVRRENDPGLADRDAGDGRSLTFAGQCGSAGWWIGYANPTTNASRRSNSVNCSLASWPIRLRTLP